MPCGATASERWVRERRRRCASGCGSGDAEHTSSRPPPLARASKTGMSAFYGAPADAASEQQAIDTIRRAVELGCTTLDTAELYNVGPDSPANNEKLVGKAIAGLDRASLQICTKWGVYIGAEGMKLDGSRAHCLEACDASLARLGVDYIDLYYLHRRDPAVPIAESAAAMKV